MYSIKLYEADIFYVTSVINSIDSTATRYKNSTKLLELASASRGLKLAKQIEAENERKRQELIAQIELERELKRLEKQREYNSYSNYPSSSYSTSRTWNNSYSDYSSISVPNLPSQYYSTNTNPNHVQVDGYYKSDGTYVESHMRTAPNNTIIDNFSTSPNLNPYTGKIGTIKFK
ncbi:hypothetical protein [Haloflavibacter putidus]|uniref:Uncharacterized protein n=1 Tax=Haloflavibacter putidus TaxID=2576776 RepID=A0A507ZGL5_9FLAO|nr:hypothetical protein [Haloflavibacter putidus]TQD34035.1 hypothetical protein FKR84_12505 [Haloflavibacter putidus]